MSWCWHQMCCESYQYVVFQGIRKYWSKYNLYVNNPCSNVDRPVLKRECMFVIFLILNASFCCVIIKVARVWTQYSLSVEPSVWEWRLLCFSHCCCWSAPSPQIQLRRTLIIKSLTIIVHWTSLLCWERWKPHWLLRRRR